MDKKNTKQLALFDFDGTISWKDSFGDFLKYALGTGRYYFGFLYLSPWVAGYLTKLIPAHRVKERVMTFFFRGMDIEEFDRVAHEFAAAKLDALVKKSAMERIQWHKEHGHTIAVVSASFENWLKPWCEKNNLSLISSLLEVKDNKLTGKLAAPNCKGAEKVNRIRREFDLESYTYIYAYGNSSGDREMLEMADEAFYQNFE